MRQLGCVSYSGDLAKKHANDLRAVLESLWYRSAFPSTRIGPFKNSETEIELTARGFRLATSVGGTLTGRGGDIIVIVEAALHGLANMILDTIGRTFRRRNAPVVKLH